VFAEVPIYATFNEVQKVVEEMECNCAIEEQLVEIILALVGTCLSPEVCTNGPFRDVDTATASSTREQIMSFRKRNIGISDGRRPQPTASTAPAPVRLPGVRPSAADGRPVTSTGSASFDGLFAGHGGLPLGTSVLLEESGTTDYAGALLRFYAAEGLMQGHHVHVVGLPEQWGRELPGLASESSKKVVDAPHDDKMKIAWRYERLGQNSADVAARGGFRTFSTIYQSYSVYADIECRQNSCCCD